MNTLLQGFADELVKVAFKSPFQPAPASTAPKPVGQGRAMPYRQPASNIPKPPNVRPAMGGRATASIPTHKLESPKGVVGTGWRPGPGYGATKAPPVADTPAKRLRKKKAPGKPGFVPWETGSKFLARRGKERAYNKQLAATKAESSMQAKVKKHLPALRARDRATAEERRTNPAQKNPVTGQTTRMGRETGTPRNEYKRYLKGQAAKQDAASKAKPMTRNPVTGTATRTPSEKPIPASFGQWQKRQDSISAIPKDVSARWQEGQEAATAARQQAATRQHQRSLGVTPKEEPLRITRTDTTGKKTRMLSTDKGYHLKYK